eukprot:scaffold1697_cov108-Skeletonema_menzelii.AAC.1
MSVMPTIKPTNAPSTNPSHQPITTASTSQPSTGPSKSRQPSTQPSTHPSLSNEPTDTNAPSTNPSHQPIIAASTTQPSTGPSKSRQPSTQPSTHPSQSNEPTNMPSSVPTLPAELPSTQPTSSIDQGVESSRLLLDFSTSLSDEQKIKFFKKGEMCNSKISLGDWDVFSNEDLFDTLEECCANLFLDDIAGCLKRSRVTFQFEFCVDMSGLNGLFDCPLPEISAIQSSMQAGLDESSSLTLTEIGHIVLTNVDGETMCSRSEYSNEFASLSASRLTKVCGTVTTKEACRDELCLKNAFKSVSQKFKIFFEENEFASRLLQSLSSDMSRSLARVKSVEVAKNSFVTKNLLLPLTVTSSPSRIVSHRDDKPPIDNATTSSHANRFYPTFVSGQLCQSKNSFDSWEVSYETLEECCSTHFFWDYEGCCKAEGMGGC